MLDIFSIPKLKHLSIKNKTALSLYPWKNCRPDKMAALTTPLYMANVAIISSAGLYIKNEQESFDTKIKGGDYSFREITKDVNLSQFKDGHRSGSFDHTGLRADPSGVMPIPQLIQLAEEGMIGKVNHRHFSVMGSILAPIRFVKKTIPEIIQKLKEDSVQIVLLIPV